MSTPLETALDALVAKARDLVANTPLAVEVEGVVGRLAGPLRVAIAGRVKAGKSTLLNALVGERLAPTDAGECTRVVWWFQEGLSYDINGRMLAGPDRPLPFTRDGGGLQVDVSGVELSQLDRVEVSWPSSALRTLTLIDTPGLASLDDSTSVRTRDFLHMEDDGPGDADAVIYLMRHVHRSDADFLDAFVDRSLDNASPVNAVGVLSRADEIGAGRIDAMESAARIAERIRNDERVRSLCVTVVPVAGLIAETGQTLREDEAASFRALAALPAELRGELLVSADRFVNLPAGDVTAETRAALLDRLGIFGVRVVLKAIDEGAATTAAELSRLLVERSGLDALRTVLTTEFLPRARALQARSVFTGLRAAAGRLAKLDPGAGAELAAAVETAEAAAHQVTELRALHLALTGAVPLEPAELAEVRLVTGSGDARTRLGAGPDLESAALQAAGRWRAKADSPLADADLVEVATAMARTYEGLYAEVRNGT